MPPETLLHSLRFRTDAHRFNGKWIIETLRALDREPYGLMAPVYHAVDSVANGNGSGNGRHRQPGRFELAYLAFVFSRYPDVHPWWAQAGHSIWTSSGFAERPSYPLVQRRFVELEHLLIARSMEQVAGRLIQRAVKGSGGRVGRYLHVDSTEAQTHARLRHVCPSSSACWRTERGRTGASTARITANADTSLVRSDRHERAALPEPEEPREDTEIGQIDEVVRRPDALKVRVGGCWYEVLDTDAGVRAYIDPARNKVKRFWVGFYNAKAIDHFTGAPVGVLISNASTNEFMSYPDVIEAAIRTTGRNPLAVVADRGYSVTPVFEFNTRAGIASVMPWRATGGRTDRAAEDTDTHDRHGIMRCKHCGGPTRFASFARSAGAGRGPRLYAVCLIPTEYGCETRQSLGCAASWRMLLPLWRNHPHYLALRNSHDRYERTHHHWRVRWRSGADDHSLRPKRKGLPVQQLRATAAMLIEWLLICEREGWMPDDRPIRPLDMERVRIDNGDSSVTGQAELRVKLGLHKPYGSAAVRAGLGPERPVAQPDAELLPDPTEPEDAPFDDGAIYEISPGATGSVQDAAAVDLPYLNDDDLPF